MRKPIITAIAIVFGTFAVVSCTNKNNAGNTTSEGTTLVDQRPHQNEGGMSADVDTVTSPGSNSVDLKNGTDSNMQNQSTTHGRDTQRGDNGTGSSATGSTAGNSGTGSGSVGSGSSGTASGSGR